MAQKLFKTMSDTGTEIRIINEYVLVSTEQKGNNVDGKYKLA